LSSTSGLTFTGILDAVQKGKIKAAYVIGYDPALHGKLDGLEFLVVQGMFPSAAGRIADLSLPAASFVEKEGTFTNAERRVQLIRPAIEPVGGSKPDWWITCQIARTMDVKGFDFKETSQIMAEVCAVTPIYEGISYNRLETGGLQWPCPSGRSEGTAILYEGSFNGGKARFTALEYNPTPESTDGDYPLLLTTEPDLYFFHAGAMDTGLAEFSTLSGDVDVTMGQGEAFKYGLNNSEKVRVITRWGELEARVKILNDALPEGVISIPLHFAHNIFSPIVDPVSGTPEYQVCAAKLAKKPVQEE